MFLMLWSGKYNKVADLYFSNSCLILIILFLQIELIFYFCFNYVVFFSKNLRIAKIYETLNISSYSLSDSFFFFFLISSLLFCKAAIVSPLYLISSLFFFKIKQAVSVVNWSGRNSNVSLAIILPFFAGLVLLLNFISSFLTFFFFIEIYGVLYYFCFLTSYSFTNFNLLKYKNGLLFLLWNNFLTSFLLSLACFMYIRFFGTSCFSELGVLNSSSYLIYAFLGGIFWKLGLPLFHFFKLEIYRYLIKENIFIFAIATTLINVVILFFVMSIPFILNTIYYHNILVILLVNAVALIIINLRVTNILVFFALSSLLTLTTVLTIFLL